MTGLEAISAHNGWAISVVGISIVFTGLVLLSTAIAQLHKVLGFFENRQENIKKQQLEREAQIELARECIILPKNMHETARTFKLLVDHLGEPFSLPKLLDSAVNCGLQQPHSSLNRLIITKAVISDDDGYYSWNDKVRH